MPPPAEPAEPAGCPAGHQPAPLISAGSPDSRQPARRWRTCAGGWGNIASAEAVRQRLWPDLTAPDSRPAASIPNQPHQSATIS